MLRLFNKIRWGKLVKAALVGAGLFFYSWAIAIYIAPSCRTKCRNS